MPCQLCQIYRFTQQKEKPYYCISSNNSRGQLFLFLYKKWVIIRGRRSVLLDHIALQLDREEIKGREDGKRLRGATIQGRRLIKGPLLLSYYSRKYSIFIQWPLFSYLQKKNQLEYWTMVHVGTVYLHGKLYIFPSPKLTFSLTSHLGQNVG